MDKLQKIKDYVINIASQLDPMHRFWHFMRVANNAKEIAQYFGEDSDDAYIAGLLHDIGRIEYRGKWVRETESENHGIIGAKIADNFLKSLDFDENRILRICQAISFHVKPNTQKTKLAKVLWDADKLSMFSDECDVYWREMLKELGFDENECEKRIIYDRSFFFQLFYSNYAKIRAIAYLQSINQRLLAGVKEWAPPAQLSEK